MALEPVIATAGTEPNPALLDMKRRFWIGLALSLPVLALEMGSHLLGLHLLAPQASNWVQFAFATPVVLWAGWPFFERGYRSLLTRNLNMFTLIALGIGVAWLYSVVATARRSRGVFRIRRHHHCSRVAGTSARTFCTRSDIGCNPRAARSHAKDRT
jgi:cation transport ATPase